MKIKCNKKKAKKELLRLSAKRTWLGNHDTEFCMMMKVDLKMLLRPLADGKSNPETVSEDSSETLVNNRRL